MKLVYFTGSGAMCPSRAQAFLVKFVDLGERPDNAAAAVVFVTQCKLPRGTKWLPLMQTG